LPQHFSVFRDRSNGGELLPKGTELESHRMEERRESSLAFPFDVRSNNQNGSNKNQNRFSKGKLVPASMAHSPPSRSEELPLEIGSPQSKPKR
jgi:hypothetical protein